MPRVRRGCFSAILTASFAVSFTSGCTGTPGPTTSEDGGPEDSQTIVIGAAGANAGTTGSDGAADATTAGAGGGTATGAAGTSGGVAGAACGAPDGAVAPPGIDASFFSEPADASFDAAFDNSPAEGGGLDVGFEGGVRGCPINAFPQGGVCTCQPSTPTVCGDTCTDLMADDANCGACGTACAATATCAGGHCGLAATSVVPAAPGCGTLTLAFSDTTLYYTDSGHGTVNSVVPSVAGAPTVIASGEAAPGPIVVSGSTLFWIDSAPASCDVPTTKGTIRMVTVSGAPSAGGAPTSLVSEVNATGGILGLAVSADGSTVYYSAGSKIRKVPAAGGAPVDVGQETQGGIPAALAVEGDAIAYPTEVDGDVDVVTSAPGTVANCGQTDPFGELVNQVDCERVARSQGGLLMTTVLFRDGSVFWVNDNNVESNISNVATADAGMANVQIASSSFGGPITALAGSSTAFYFGEDDAGLGAYIERAGLDFSVPPVRLARGQAKVLSIAAGPTRVYWSTSACVINATGL